MRLVVVFPNGVSLSDGRELGKDYVAGEESWYPTLRQKESEGWGTHSFVAWEDFEKQPQVLRLRSG